MCGTLIFGLLGDRIGRIKALILANFCGFLGDFSTIFTDNLTAFSITRFVSGLAIDSNTYLMYILGEFFCFLQSQSNVNLSIFVVVLEYVSPSLRDTGLLISTTLFYGLGMICSSWIAVWVGHWKKFLVCSSLPLLLFALYYFLMQESAQWLVTRNDIDGAVKRLHRVSKINGRTLSECDINEFRNYYQNTQENKQKLDKFTDILKTPHLRKTFIKMITVL